MPEISVIIVTYNADWQKLKMTINSVLMQKDVSYEVLFADDGSKKKWNKEISEYIQDRCSFTFVDSINNVGTVSNILNALENAQGRYVKVISPGDCFFSDDSVKRWIEHMKSSKADLSFCNAVYYKHEGSAIEIVQEKSSPKNIYLYHETNNRRKLFVDYLLANDFILGASVLAERKVMSYYLTEMREKVKYAEDYMIRLMIFDNRKIEHINDCLIWYEYGGGISTNGNNSWKKLLQRDFEATNSIIENRRTPSEKIQKKYQLYLIKKNEKIKKIVKVVLFPTTIFYRIKMKHSYEKTFLADSDRLKKLIN